jgi:hypothetical protein
MKNIKPPSDRSMIVAAEAAKRILKIKRTGEWRWQVPE